MKLSLRNKYFGWLLLLLLFAYGLLLTALSAIELHEAHIEKTPFSNEIPEIAAFIMVMAFTVPVIIFAAWHIAGRLLRPLRQVLSTAEHISQGNLDERIPPLAQRDELSRLADTINDAFDRYRSAVNRLEHFSADASHQLRTPLTAIKSSAEVALQSVRSPESYRDSLGEILEHTRRLNETIDQLLMLSRIDRSMIDSFLPLDLNTLFNKWVADAREMFEEIHVSCEIRLAEDVRIRGNEVLLHEVFANLIDNARAFTPAGGKIHIDARVAEGNLIEWRIEDSGPGIPESDRQRIFDRFYRGQQSTHKGSGLGLAIVREIVALHGGSIKAARSELLGGAAMIIRLPA